MRSRPKPKEYDLEAANKFFTSAVFYGARCIVCSEKKGLQAHHAIPKAWIEQVARRLRLSNEERNALLWSPQNATSLCARCHERHTTAYRRVPRYLLPAAVWEFVEHVDGLLGTQEATVRLEREYPET